MKLKKFTVWSYMNNNNWENHEILHLIQNIYDEILHRKFKDKIICIFEKTRTSLSLYIIKNDRIIEQNYPIIFISTMMTKYFQTFNQN